MFKKLILNLYKLFHTTEEERTLFNSFYEASITPIPTVDKGITRKQTSMPQTIATSLNKQQQTNPATEKNDYMP